MVFADILRNFSKAVLLLGFVMFGFVAVAPAQAQQQPPVAQTGSVSTTAPANSADPKSELKTSLTELSTLYQNEVQRLEKQQQQSKQLYDDGLISRVELEKADKAVESQGKPPVWRRTEF